MLIRRICVRYEDGRRVCFVPEAGEEGRRTNSATRGDVYYVTNTKRGGGKGAAEKLAILDV